METLTHSQVKERFWEDLPEVYKNDSSVIFYMDKSGWMIAQVPGSEIIYYRWSPE